MGERWEEHATWALHEPHGMFWDSGLTPPTPPRPSPLPAHHVSTMYFISPTGFSEEYMPPTSNSWRKASLVGCMMGWGGAERVGVWWHSDGMGRAHGMCALHTALDAPALPQASPAWSPHSLRAGMARSSTNRVSLRPAGGPYVRPWRLSTQPCAEGWRGAIARFGQMAEHAGYQPPNMLPPFNNQQATDLNGFLKDGGRGERRKGESLGHALVGGQALQELLDNGGLGRSGAAHKQGGLHVRGWWRAWGRMCGATVPLTTGMRRLLCQNHTPTQMWPSLPGRQSA